MRICWFRFSSNRWSEMDRAYTPADAIAEMKSRLSTHCWIRCSAGNVNT